MITPLIMPMLDARGPARAESGTSAADVAEWSGETEQGHQLACRSRAGAICADRRRRGAVANQVYTRILGHLGGQSTGHGDAAACFAQHQRRQMVERAAKSGAPQDDISANNHAVGPAHTV